MESVKRVYEGLRNGEGQAMAELFASDVDWWFHGPPHCEYLKRILTGERLHSSFAFSPKSMTAVSPDMVVVEGEGKGNVYWVHVWTVSSKDGRITRLREYFNTCLVVRNARDVWQSSPLALRSSMPALVLAL